MITRLFLAPAGGIGFGSMTTVRGTRQRHVGAVDTSSPGPSFPLREGKLTPPPLRRGVVERSTLLERVVGDPAVPMTLIIAPAGYGKTTLLVQAAEADPRATVWVSMDDRDNDPGVLLTHIATSFDRAWPDPPSPFAPLSTPGSWLAPGAMDSLNGSISSFPIPFAMFIDDVHTIRHAGAMDALDALAAGVPAGSTAIIASRVEPGPRAARIRAQGRLLEIGPSDLAMDDAEATSLLLAAGSDLSPEDAVELRRRTEGWPAALYLAALSLQAGGSARDVSSFTGHDRFVVDYLRSEFLDALTDDEVAFLTRTSVLSAMSGPLCDAVLEESGSAKVLAALAEDNQLIIPLDRDREWYRYHHLFQESLRAELGSLEPDLVPVLNLRAATWLEAQGLNEAAIEYAFAADETDLAARLVEQVALGAFWGGRVETVYRWFDRFDDATLERWPTLAVDGSWLYSLAGTPTEADRWADLAERRTSEVEVSEGSTSITAARARLLSLRCEHEVDDTLASALLACETEPPWDDWRTVSLTMLGFAQILRGDVAAADRAFAEAAEVAASLGAVPDRALALGERAVLALAASDWSSAQVLADEARALVGRAHLGQYTTSALPFAVSARLAVHHGSLRQARNDLDRARQLSPRLTYAMPVLAVQTRLEIARTCLALSDPASASLLLQEIDAIVRHRPNLGALLPVIEDLRHRIDDAPGGALSAHTLTAAELRLLPMLPTASVVRRDRREALRLPQHGEDAGDLDLSQAGGLVSERGCRTSARDRAARRVADERVSSPAEDARLRLIRFPIGLATRAGADAAGTRGRTSQADAQPRERDRGRAGLAHLAVSRGGARRQDLRARAIGRARGHGRCSGLLPMGRRCRARGRSESQRADRCPHHDRAHRGFRARGGGRARPCARDGLRRRCGPRGSR